jgi:hypothetical protein
MLRLRRPLSEDGAIFEADLAGGGAAPEFVMRSAVPFSMSILQ